MTQYEYIQALQLVDLNWAILQLKASAQAELSSGTERTIRQRLTLKLEGDSERDFNRQLRAFIDTGGDEDDFEDPIDWNAIGLRIETLMADLKSKDPVRREQATAVDLTRRRPKARAEWAVSAKLQLQPSRARPPRA